MEFKYITHVLKCMAEYLEEHKNIEPEKLCLDIPVEIRRRICLMALERGATARRLFPVIANVIGAINLVCDIKGETTYIAGALEGIATSLRNSGRFSFEIMKKEDIEVMCSEFVKALQRAVELLLKIEKIAWVIQSEEF